MRNLIITEHKIWRLVALMILFQIWANQMYAQNLIVNHTGYRDCVGNKGFSASFNRKCHPDRDSSQFPWCHLSNIGFKGSCSGRDLKQFIFEFHTNDPYSGLQYIQGQFCHELWEGTAYQLAFDISIFNLSDADMTDLYCHFSDTVLDEQELKKLTSTSQPIPLSIHFEKNTESRFSIRHSSKGGERYFQIWLKPKNKKVNRYFRVYNLSLISAADTQCHYPVSNDAKQKSADTFSIKTVILFAFGRSELAHDEKVKINESLSSLKENDAVFVSIKISGYTDTTGNDDYNVKLSQKRAESILEYLRETGIHCANQYIFSHGEDSLNHTEKQAFNRRVELEIEYIYP